MSPTTNHSFLQIVSFKMANCSMQHVFCFQLTAPWRALMHAQYWTNWDCLPNMCCHISNSLVCLSKIREHFIFSLINVKTASWCLSARPSLCAVKLKHTSGKEKDLNWKSLFLCLYQLKSPSWLKDIKIITHYNSFITCYWSWQLKGHQGETLLYWALEQDI